MMNQTELDRTTYSLAKEFLIQLGVNGLTQELLEKYLNPSEKALRRSTIAAIYEHLLAHAKNANMKSRVIGKIDCVRHVLCDFERSTRSAPFVSA